MTNTRQSENGDTKKQFEVEVFHEITTSNCFNVHKSFVLLTAKRKSEIVNNPVPFLKVKKLMMRKKNLLFGAVMSQQKLYIFFGAIYCSNNREFIRRIEHSQVN